MNTIIFKTDITPKTSEILEVYKSSGIKRPINEPKRIKKMYENSNLIITAWLDDELVGVSRSITDFCYACYLSDLAVKEQYQKEGIGKRLIELTEQEIGKETALILLSAPIAMAYYPQIGFEKVDNRFIIRRTK